MNIFNYTYYETTTNKNEYLHNVLSKRATIVIIILKINNEEIDK